MRNALLAGLLAVTPAVAAAQGGTLPVSTYDADQLYTHISPTMGEGKAQNQPTIVNGWLLLAGNGKFELWDIADPFAPVQLSTFDSPYNIGEAESHQVAVRHTADDRWQVVTISGFGVDLWDLTDPTAPELLSAMILDGIDYGDNSEAVWGVAWQGDTIWVGGTNTGLHVVDASDPRDPQLITRIPTTEFGGISAGPLWAIGDLLVVTTPKNHGGIVTLDIGDPTAPAVLDFEIPEDSYIGGFYRTHLHLLSPFRSYEVLEDPSDIRLVGSFETPETEYLTFGDGKAFVGRLRPNPGALELDLADLSAYDELAYHEGRRDDVASGYFTDDQFTLPIGNLLVLADDEIRYGAVLTVTDTASDSVPPRVSAIRPADGASGVATTARIGVSLTDQVELRSVTPETLIVRPVLGGPAVTGDWDLTQTVLGFSPHEPLAVDTAYEVVLPAGGITDLSGNPLATEARAVFTTGDGSLPPTCGILDVAPVAVGTPTSLRPEAAAGVRWSWEFGDGVRTEPSFDGLATHAWDTPGRWPVTLTVHGKSGARSCTAIQIVHRPVLETPPPVAGPIAVDEEAGRAWVANRDAGTVSAVDLATHGVLWEVSVGEEPTSVARTDDGVVVVVRGDDSLSVLDDDGALVRRIEMAHGSGPWAVTVLDGMAYVTLDGSRTVGTWDLDTGAPSQSFRFPDDEDGRPFLPRGLAVHPDGTVLLSRFLSPRAQGEVVRLDLDEDRATVIPLRADPGPDTDRSGRGVPNVLAHVALSPDGTRLAVPSNKANVGRGLARDGEPLNPQNTVRSIVSIVDLAGAEEQTELRQDLDDHDSPWAAAWSPLGDLLFVVSRGTNRVDVLDVDAGRQIAGFATGRAPTGVALAGATLLVHDSLDRTLTLLDVSGLLDGTDAAAPRIATVPLIAEEPLAPAVLAGKRLFNNASTREMSQDGYLSCATCHPDGASDERVWDFTDRGEGLRNTIDLRGRGGTDHGRIHWSGNFDEVQDFENDIRNHFGGSGFMEDADFAATSDTLGDAKAGRSERLDALAAYVTSLDRYPNSGFRDLDGSLTASGLAGQRVFDRLNCVECHGGEHLTDSATGARHDVGTLTDASGGRLGAALDGLDTPTLFGLHASAPYLHDGSAETLEEVLRIEGHGDAQGLSQRNMDDLVTFLLSLDSVEIEPAAGCGCDVDSRGPRGPGSFLLLALFVGVRRRRG